MPHACFSFYVLNIAVESWTGTSSDVGYSSGAVSARVGMVQEAIKPQPGRNFPDFNSVRTAQKVVEACEVGVGSWP
jgi:hypothetical protein